MSGSTEVESRVWTARFSGSAEWQSASSTVSNGEHAIVISSASCTYYYSQLLREEPPPFHSSFVKWVYRLNEANINDTDIFVEFFDSYGTHFPTEMVFGARFTNEYEMTSDSLEEIVNYCGYRSREY